MDWHTALLVQPGPLLCVHGFDKTIFRPDSHECDAMVDSYKDEGERGCFRGGADELDEGREN